MDDVLSRLQPIFRDVFDDPHLTVTAESSARTVADWDSLAQINLVSAIEQDFKIRFRFGELEKLQNVGEMVDLITTKLAP